MSGRSVLGFFMDLNGLGGKCDKYLELSCVSLSFRISNVGNHKFNE